MKVLTALSLVFLLHFQASIFADPTFFVSSLTTNKKVKVSKIECPLGQKCKLDDEVALDLPTQGGLTGIAPLTNGNIQVIWNARNPSGKIKIDHLLP